MRSLFLFTMVGSFSFAQDWMAMGNGGSIGSAPDRATEFRYELGKKGISAAVLPAGDSMATMKSLRFRTKTDHDTTVAVVLSERKPGGGNYTALFWAPANQWQQIELTPADFAVSDGPNDPVDADGKLDLDQVEGVAVFDLANLLADAMPGGKIVVTKAAGPHSLFIDKFEVRSSGITQKQETIDAFDRGFLQWLSPGGMTLKFVPETGPLGEPSLKATYSDTSEPYAVMVRQVGGLNLGKAKHLLFDIASEHEATILISIEMKKGARYHFSINPPAERKVFHVDASLDDFEREGDSGPATFDPAQWKSIVMLDISGGNMQNTFWLGNLRVK
jgi:hypothetical protein